MGLRNGADFALVGRWRIPGGDVDAIECLSALGIVVGGRTDQVVDHGRADVSKALMPI